MTRWYALPYEDDEEGRWLVASDKHGNTPVAEDLDEATAQQIVRDHNYAEEYQHKAELLVHMTIERDALRKQLTKAIRPRAEAFEAMRGALKQAVPALNRLAATNDPAAAYTMLDCKAALALADAAEKGD